MTKNLAAENRDLKEIVGRVDWWLNDIRYKAPEQLDQLYFLNMCRDLSDVIMQKRPV